MILNDISKITGLNKEILDNILKSPDFYDHKIQDEIIDQKFFKSKNFRKIKKKLIFDIANARIEEMAEIYFKKCKFFKFQKKLKYGIYKYKWKI